MSNKRIGLSCANERASFNTVDDDLDHEPGGHQHHHDDPEAGIG